MGLTLRAAMHTRTLLAAIGHGQFTDAGRTTVRITATEPLTFALRAGTMVWCATLPLRLRLPHTCAHSKLARGAGQRAAAAVTTARPTHIDIAGVVVVVNALPPCVVSAV